MAVPCLCLSSVSVNIWNNSCKTKDYVKSEGILIHCMLSYVSPHFPKSIQNWQWVQSWPHLWEIHQTELNWHSSFNIIEVHCRSGSIKVVGLLGNRTIDCLHRRMLIFFPDVYITSFSIFPLIIVWPDRMTTERMTEDCLAPTCQFLKMKKRGENTYFK